MLGSIFIHSKNPEDLKALIEDPDSLEDFDYIEMDRLLTLDFEIALSESGIRWTSEEPIVLQQEEDSGTVVVRVMPDALNYALSNPERFNDEVSEDLNLLREFTDHFGSEHIYEFSTW